jgi:asparagine synthase (glutamine-hydrolysing)
MCGIVVFASNLGPVDDAAVLAGLDRLRHRGPDGAGRIYRWNGALAMGHRRLAIFDTSDGAAQPMVAPDTGDSVVFNGSIYNFPELRDELSALGHRFLSNSDTEVVLAAWREWGEDAFTRFNGTWAIALHDAASDRLIITRDRAGVRPLYMMRDARRTIIASEVRAVLAAAGIKPIVDQSMAFDFLTLGLSDHEGRTMVDGIVQIPAGAFWSLHRDGTLARGAFHQWPEPDPTMTARDCAPDLADLILDATRLRLRADVPVAAQLSGGLDSGAVAWAIGRVQRESKVPFSGFFTYGYRDEAGFPFDEVARAVSTRDHVAPGLPLTVLRFAAAPDLSDLEDFLEAQELPVNTPSPMAGFRIYRAMRDVGAVVALGGDASDEIFAGYCRRYLPVALRDALIGMHWGATHSLLRAPELHWRDAMARLAWELPKRMMIKLILRRPHMEVLTADFRAACVDRLESLIDLQRQPLEQMGHRDSIQMLLPQILRFADRNAMRFGMESRAPFLDHRIVEMALRLPMAQKVGALGGKLPLRIAMDAYLPSDIARGYKNRGLGHAEQFQIGRLDLQTLLDDPPSAGRAIIDAGRLRTALRRNPGDSRLWWSVCMLLWLRQLEAKWP